MADKRIIQDLKNENYLELKAIICFYQNNRLLLTIYLFRTLLKQYFY